MNWKSRKQRLVLAGVLVAIAGALTGETTWAQSIYVIVGLFASLITGIAIEDAGTNAGAGK